MQRPDLNIIVCVNPRRCLLQHSYGRSSDDLLRGLRQVVRNQRLEEQVQVNPCRCIFGCTYGPRIDVARRWSGEKVLYGTIEGEATISRRGRVEILEDLSRLIKDNLLER
jgi:hypothetical protein